MRANVRGGLLIVHLLDLDPSRSHLGKNMFHLIWKDWKDCSSQYPKSHLTTFRAART